MLLNVDENAKIPIESDLSANVRFFSRMNVSSHRWSPFHLNDCVFSRNKPQKECLLSTSAGEKLMFYEGRTIRKVMGGGRGIFERLRPFFERQFFTQMTLKKRP